MTYEEGFGKFEYAYSITETASASDGSTVYGIDARMREDGGPVSRERLDDIFCTRAEAEEFMAALKENGVDPCHLRDVAEDWLAR